MRPPIPMAISTNPRKKLSIANRTMPIGMKKQPATIAIIKGEMIVGLNEEEINNKLQEYVDVNVNCKTSEMAQFYEKADFFIL